MHMNPYRKRQKSGTGYGQVLRALHILYMQVARMAKQMEIELAEGKAEAAVYRDREYVLDRVGISDRTLLRFQALGLIRIAKRANGKKYYLDADVERFRRYYHGAERS